MIPKLVITDIDGVWTDGGMYYDETGNEFKKFNTTDSAGIIFCKKANIPVAIITGENTKLVKRRANKLGVDFLYMGIQDKLQCASDLCDTLNITLADVAYIGDDINDIKLLLKVGLSACPSNAPEYIKKICHWNLPSKGGDGVFRLFVEQILISCNLFPAILNEMGIDYQK